MYADIAGSNKNAEDNNDKIAYNRRKRELPAAVIMRWQRLPVSCNRAISKKLWVMRVQAFIRAAEVRKKATRKQNTRKKRDALARNDAHWAGQLCILI